MKILLACEESQAVTKAFRAKGYEAYSCDTLPCSGGHPEWHIQGDVQVLFHSPHKLGVDISYWDIVIAFTPCDFQANSGVRWLFDKDGNKVKKRWLKLEQTLSLFNSFTWYRKQGKIGALVRENPIPHKYARDGFINENGVKVNGMGRYNQIVQPWQFGHKEMKGTCFWVNGLPLLKPTDIVGPPPKDKEERKKWAKIHRMPPVWKGQN